MSFLFLKGTVALNSVADFLFCGSVIVKTTDSKTKLTICKSIGWETVIQKMKKKNNTSDDVINIVLKPS